MDIKKKWFVLNVIKNKEKFVFDRITTLNLENIVPFLPEKKIKIRRKGILHNEQIPLYPGYIFIIGELKYTNIKTITAISGVIKFVGKKENPSTIAMEEKQLILSITTNGIVEYSKAINVGRKIKIISGPLKDLEGKILSVDRRKQKAVVGLPLLNSIVKTTLSFEYIEE